MKFGVGDKVVWTSQSMGTHLTKIGRVVAVVAGDEDPMALVPNPSTITIPKFGMPRKTESYLVLVQPLKGTAKPRLFWPVASLLQLVKKA